MSILIPSSGPYFMGTTERRLSKSFSAMTWSSLRIIQFLRSGKGMAQLGQIGQCIPLHGIE